MEHMTERKFRREESNPIVKEDKAVLENYTLGASRAVLKLFFNDYQGPAAIRLWNDETVIGNENALFTLVFRESHPLIEYYKSNYK